MHRRDFLKALAAVGAGVVVAESIAKDVAKWDESDFIAQDVFAPRSWPYPFVSNSPFEQIFGLKVYTAEEKARPVDYILKRVKSNIPLFGWHLNGYGHFMEWKASPYADDAIVVAPGAEIEIVADFDGASTILSRELRDEQMTNVIRHFVHTRRRPTVGYEMLPEDNFKVKRITHEV